MATIMSRPRLKRKHIICIATIKILFIYILARMLFSQQPPKDKDGNLNLSHVIVHLDLKGAPPKLSYLTTLLPQMKELGATGLLLEYEDMFPYKGKLANLSAINCYGRQELKRFIRSATSLGLVVIPLVQTFGHLESALKLREYQHLREEPDFPDTICPSGSGGGALVAAMLQQVLEFHKHLHPVKFVHIGCDEAYHINSCTVCRKRMKTHEEIFLQHVIDTSTRIKRKYPETTILIWDDMMRGIPLLYLKKFKLRSLVEPVVWDYKPDISIRDLTIFNYHNTFNNIWIASAFKGAQKKTTMLPDVSDRLRNQLSWMRFIDGYRIAGTKEVYGFRGIILTGWSRFSHFDPLCEILPISLPSLWLSLLAVNEFVRSYGSYMKKNGSRYLDTVILNKLKLKLECSKHLDFNLNKTLNLCRFQERDLHQSLDQLNTVENVLVDEEKKLYHVDGDLIDYYISHKHVNPNVLENIERKFKHLQLQLIVLGNKIVEQMKLFYEDHVIKEYINYRLHFLLNKASGILTKVTKMETVKIWEPRGFF